MTLTSIIRRNTQVVLSKNSEITRIRDIINYTWENKLFPLNPVFSVVLQNNVSQESEIIKDVTSSFPFQIKLTIYFIIVIYWRL